MILNGLQSLKTNQKASLNAEINQILTSKVPSMGSRQNWASKDNKDPIQKIL
jgi:hypothetical protein